MKKTSYINIIIVLGITMLLMSCEEIIDIELNSENPVIVAEGYIELDSVAKLKLSYSSDYFTNSSGAYLENSSVIIIDDLGNVDTLLYMGEGNYLGENITGALNRTYRITFTEADKVFEANTKIFPPSEILDISFEESQMVGPGPGHGPGQSSASYIINMKFTDNTSLTNYYLIDVFVNGNLDRNSYTLVESSSYSNNGVVEYKPFRASYKIDEEIRVVVYSIDEASHRFYSQMNDALGGGIGPEAMSGSSTPYNPTSNFGPEVVGLFSGRSFDESSVVVE